MNAADRIVRLPDGSLGVAVTSDELRVLVDALEWARDSVRVGADEPARQRTRFDLVQLREDLIAADGMRATAASLAAADVGAYARGARFRFRCRECRAEVSCTFPTVPDSWAFCERCVRSMDVRAMEPAR